MRFATRFIGIFLAGIASFDLQAATPNHSSDLGICIAYAYVRSDLDGSKPVPDELRPGLTVLSKEYMFETALEGISADDAHAYVVDQLVNLNQFKMQHGMDLLDRQYQAMCGQLAASLATTGRDQ